MKFYYIATREAFEKAAQDQHFKEAHYINLNSGKVLVVAKFHDEGMELRWRKSHPDVEPMPHILSNRKIHPDHAEHLKHHGVLPTHTTWEAMEKVGDYAPLHYPGVF